MPRCFGAIHNFCLLEVLLNGVIPLFNVVLGCWAFHEDNSLVLMMEHEIGWQIYVDGLVGSELSLHPEDKTGEVSEFAATNILYLVFFIYWIPVGILELEVVVFLRRFNVDSVW